MILNFKFYAFLTVPIEVLFVNGSNKHIIIIININNSNYYHHQQSTAIFSGLNETLA